MEFALLENPLIPDATILPKVSLINGFLTLAYDRPIAADGLIYRVRFTSDLGNWNPGNVIPQSSTPSPDGSLSEVWRFMSNTQSAPRIFARLKVLLE
ncbi:MAG: hypothetical protein ACJAVK_002844 [Akkermansiaceae bacterium]|jgi:hypothetical protein